MVDGDFGDTGGDRPAAGALRKGCRPFLRLAAGGAMPSGGNNIEPRIRSPVAFLAGREAVFPGTQSTGG